MFGLISEKKCNSKIYDLLNNLENCQKKYFNSYDELKKSNKKIEKLKTEIEKLKLKNDKLSLDLSKNKNKLNNYELFFGRLPIYYRLIYYTDNHIAIDLSKNLLNKENQND